MTVEGARVGFAGLRVAAFESRLAEQMRQLIERYGGRPLVAPSMREVPLEENADGLRFGERLLAGEFEMVLLLTGVGTRFMLKVLDSRWPREQTLAALGKTILVARGAAPIGCVRRWRRWWSRLSVPSWPSACAPTNFRWTSSRPTPRWACM